MGINLGAFLAPFVCGYIGREFGWHYGFGTAGIVALSMITKLAPPRFTNFMLGSFFFSIAFAQLPAQQIAKHFTVAHELKAVAHIHDKGTSFYIFRQVFEFLIYLPLGSGVVMLMLSPLLKSVFERYR